MKGRMRSALPGGDGSRRQSRSRTEVQGNSGLQVECGKRTGKKRNFLRITGRVKTSKRGRLRERTLEEKRTQRWQKVVGSSRKVPGIVRPDTNNYPEMGSSDIQGVPTPDGGPVEIP